MHNCVYNSLITNKKHNTPWVHYEVENFLDNELYHFIQAFKFPTNEEIVAAPAKYCTLRKFDKVAKLLKREQYKQSIADNRHSCEVSFTQTFRQQNEQADRLFEMFLDANLINYLEKLGNITLKDSFLRIQLIKDIDGYAIAPHIDREKLFTLQCFFMTHTEKDLGTILLSDHGDQEIKRTLYKENAGTFFFPTEHTSNDTWHSFHGKIAVQRISLMVNYFSSIPLGNNSITNADAVFYKL